MPLIAVLTVLSLALRAIRANQSLPPADRLPMQFGPTGAAGWSAPRRVALGVMPGLGAVIMGAVVLLPAETGQVVATLTSALALILGQQLHLWLIQRHLNR